MVWAKIRFMAYGVILGTAGIKALTSRDAKKVYAHITAAAMRVSDSVVRTAESFRENCEDIAAEAKNINEKRIEEQRALEIEDANA